ncbi:MAG: MCE family protein [Flavobacteriales bacterium]|nr:MCE family protein [Flavobacteriales bacterium]
MLKLKREHSIAVIVLVALALLAFGLNFLKGIDLLQRRNVYHVMYANAQGLGDASPLLYKGLKIGQVQQLQLAEDGSGLIQVTYQVNQRSLFIPKDSKVIISGDLFGKWAILEPGVSKEPAEVGSFLEGNTQPSLTESVAANIDPLKRKAEGMIASVDSVLTSLQAILNPGTIGDIDSSFTSVRRTLETLERTAKRVDDLVAAESMALRATIENMEKLSRSLADNRDEMDRIFSNLDTLAASLASGRMDRALENMAQASDQMKTLMERLNSGQGTMGKLMTNDSLYNNLTAASAELDLLLEDLRVNPNRYFSVFGKKDRLPKLSDADVKRIQQAMQEQR